MRWLVSRRNLLWSFLIISLAFNAGFGTTFGVRSYRHPGRGGGPGPGAPCQGFRDRLNLTAEQEARMNAARERLFLQVAEVRRRLAAERETLGSLLAASEPDRNAIGLQLDRITELQRQLQQHVIDHVFEEKEVLSPEQREAYNEVIRQRVCPWGGRGPEGLPGGCEISPGHGRRHGPRCDQECGADQGI
jgi:Spy/CpxP family protein refolding chaperone